LRIYAEVAVLRGNKGDYIAMPAKSEDQRRLAAWVYKQRKKGKDPEKLSGMSMKELKEFMHKPKKKKR